MVFGDEWRGVGCTMKMMEKRRIGDRRGF